MPGSPIPPPPAPPRRITFTVSLNLKNLGRASLADANDYVGGLIRIIDDGELRNRSGEPISAYIANFEVGQ